MGPFETSKSDQILCRLKLQEYLHVTFTNVRGEMLSFLSKFRFLIFIFSAICSNLWSLNSYFADKMSLTKKSSCLIKNFLRFFHSERHKDILQGPYSLTFLLMIGPISLYDFVKDGKMSMLSNEYNFLKQILSF